MSAPHLLHAFATFAPGGPQVRTVRLMAALGGEFRHSVLPLDGCRDAAALLPPELGVELIEPPPRAGSLRTAHALRRSLKALRPDLLLTYNWGAIDALLAARSLRLRRVIHHEDGFRPDEVGGQKRRRVWLRRRLLPGARAVVVPSRTLERIALGAWRLPPATVRYVPNGIALDAFEAADGNPALRDELGLPRDAVVIGAVGHLRAEKNVARLLRAAAELQPETQLLILGDGPERPALVALADELGLAGRVHFAGHRAETSPWYRAMDAFALSSDTEQMPVALLEAMASGLPVAATDVGDVRAMLPAEQRPLVVPLEPTGAAASRLAAALGRLVAEPDLRRQLGALNRGRAQSEFAFARMRDAYAQLYRAILGTA